jgi:hypothetical protein
MQDMAKCQKARKLNALLGGWACGDNARITGKEKPPRGSQGASVVVAWIEPLKGYIFPRAE